jgi:hypothetical protein
MGDEQGGQRLCVHSSSVPCAALMGRRSAVAVKVGTFKKPGMVPETTKAGARAGLLDSQNDETAQLE